MIKFLIAWIAILITIALCGLEKADIFHSNIELYESKKIGKTLLSVIATINRAHLAHRIGPDPPTFPYVLSQKLCQKETVSAISQFTKQQNI